MQLIKKSADVYVCAEDISVIGVAEIELLKTSLDATPNGRIRINVHPSSDDTLHEMFIAIRRGSYIRPHKHPIKSEAFHMVHGSARVVIYDDLGNIIKVVALSAGHTSSTSFYYRMSKPYFHTLIIDSDFIVMHEITNGPFVVGGTIYGDFSPVDSDKAAIAQFHTDLSARLDQLDQAS